MKTFVASNMSKPAEMSAAPLSDIRAILRGHICESVPVKVIDNLGSILRALATKLSSGDYKGWIPMSQQSFKAVLKEVDGAVGSFFVQQAFGRGDVTVGLNGRKILTALDMVDWEEICNGQKSEVKMNKLLPYRVSKSLKTWMPGEQCLRFYDVTESLGDVFARNEKGLYGHITNTITKKLKGEEKKMAKEMVDKILQMYKATRGCRNL